MAREINMEVSIDTTKSELKLLKLQDELKSLKKEARNISEDDKAFGAWANAINDTENEMAKLKSTMKQNKTETNATTQGFKTLGDKVSGAFESTGKKAKRFTLALFSIRGVFSLISKSSRAYLSENEQTSNAVAGAWEYLGNVIGPVIEKVVSWLRYGIAYLNVFLKALTGVDFLAKSIQKSTAKTNKELKKTLSSMDEIVNLDLDSSSSGASPGSALQDIADLELNPEVVNFMEKLGEATRKVWEFAVGAWNFLEKHFGTTGAMAIVGGLALIIGGSTFGLNGVLAALSLIAAVELGTVISQFSELKKSINEQYETEKKALGAKIALYNYYKQQYESANNEEDRAYYLDKMKTAYEDMANTVSTTNVDLSETVKLAESWSGYYDETKSLAQQLDEATKSAKDTLDDIDGSTKKVTLKMDADTSLAESKTGNFFSRLWSQVKYSSQEVWRSIKFAFTGKAYATGGFPETGQMFIANEKGPELVGNIGSSTAVVNNNQIVESVAQGVASAVSSVLVQGNNKSSQNATYLYINGSEFAKAVYNDMQTESQRRNTNTSIRRV